MICCKIVTNFNDINGNFNNLFTKLTNIGDIIWSNGSLFFSDTENNVTVNQIKKIVKNSGYVDAFINVYDEHNVPQENDEINIWLTDKLIKINYKQCEEKNQEAFRNLAHGLDELEIEINKLEKKALQNINSKSDKEGEEENIHGRRKKRNC